MEDAVVRIAGRVATEANPEGDGGAVERGLLLWRAGRLTGMRSQVRLWSVLRKMPPLPSRRSVDRAGWSRHTCRYHRSEGGPSIRYVEAGFPEIGADCILLEAPHDASGPGALRS